MNPLPISAIAVFPSGSPKNSKVKGTVVFKESVRSSNVVIEIDLDGLSPGKHGFHIHETGNLTEDCKNCKGHFNPFQKNHGGLYSKERHVGDLGNIIADEKGVCKMRLYDNQISLRTPKRNIIGRSLVIHSGEDDLGRGDNDESMVTGNSGSRVACAVIGYETAYYHY